MKRLLSLLVFVVFCIISITFAGYTINKNDKVLTTKISTQIIKTNVYKSFKSCENLSNNIDDKFMSKVKLSLGNKTTVREIAIKAEIKNKILINLENKLGCQDYNKIQTPQPVITPPIQIISIETGSTGSTQSFYSDPVTKEMCLGNLPTTANSNHKVIPSYMMSSPHINMEWHYNMAYETCAYVCKPGFTRDGSNCVTLSVSSILSDLGITSTETVLSGIIIKIPRIMLRYGKVNQHINLINGKWETDADGRAGAGDYQQRGDNGRGNRKLEYCKRFYPETKSVEPFAYEVSDTWKDAGNVGYYASIKQSFLCVQTLGGGGGGSNKLARKEIDNNCTRSDTTFTYQGKEYTWAGCNSTLGNGVENGIKNNYGPLIGNNLQINNCNGDLLETQTSYVGYLIKEKDMSPFCKIDNIFGKFYKRDSNKNVVGGAGIANNCKHIEGQDDFFGTTNNPNCPCPDGRHVPNKEERNVAVSYFGGLDIGGRNGSSNGIVQKLQLPLGGFLWNFSVDGINESALNRGFQGFAWSSNKASGFQPSLGKITTITYYNTANNVSFSNNVSNDLLPVRCIRN